MKFHPWVHDEDDASLAAIEQFPEELQDEAWRLDEGEPAAGWFPRSPVFQLASGSGVRLADAIPNVLGIGIVSPRLRGILEETEAEIEFLPVRLRDHKGRIIKTADYCIANVLSAVSCVDMQRSRFTTQALFPEQVDHFHHLILDERRIDEDERLFRLVEKMDLVLVREDLLKEILDTGCTGLTVVNLADYGALFRD